MSKPDQLRIRDVRAAYRLLGECCEIGSDADAWRRHMLEGLRRLTGAQVALYMQLRNAGAGNEEIAAPLDAGFLDSGGRRLWAHYQREKAYRDDPIHLGLLSNHQQAFRTRRLESMVRAEDWYRSRHYNDYVRACGLDDRITTLWRMPGSAMPIYQIMVLHRADEDGQYSRRDQRLVHLFHHEMTRHLGRQLSLPDADSQRQELPYRLQQVLSCLLEGDSQKQIAYRLELSPRTVDHHIQRLFRKFDVHSRAELMARCSGKSAPPAPTDKAHPHGDVANFESG